jgi:dipeptidyl-peptidase-4
VYLHRENGTTVRQVTTGKWEVRVVHGVDEHRQWIYFSGTERSHIGRDVYRIRFDGTGLQRLSGPEGTHTATFSPGFSFYLDRWSDVQTPPQTRLHDTDGREVRLIDANRVAAFTEFRYSKPEFLQVQTRDGFVMEAMMIKPPHFRPDRKYPVYQWVYGGPHSQRVLNAWTSENMFLQLLAHSGIVIWVCDNRTASGKGAESTWPAFKRLGESELRDIEDGLSWLKQQPYIDGTRIGIHGWSYGGFLTSYALTHSTSFIMGIAGGTVSDWRNYDTIYTERFLQTPQKNPEGYRASSPRFFADRLHGRLLLLHGTIDDNVHVQNTLQFAYELQRAGKPFELMLYPRSRHAVTDPQLVYHMRKMMFAFILENLKP